MNDNEKHRALVRRLKKFPGDISPNLDPTAIDMMHASLGLAGEAGEVVDMVKKRIINGHDDPDFRVKLGLEIGDVMFYIQMLLMSQGLTLDEVLRVNMLKLEKRYPDGYSDQASKDRVDVA